MRDEDPPEGTSLLDEALIAAEMLRARSKRLWRATDELRRLSAANHDLIQRLHDEQQADTREKGHAA